MSLKDVVRKVVNKTGKMFYNEKGEEILDETPVALPLGFKPPIPLNETIRRMTRMEMSRLAQENGDESFEEADDFDTGEQEPKSPWEEDFDPDFVGAREDEIRHHVTQPMDETKIDKGVAEYKRLRQQAKRERSGEHLDFDEELPNDDKVRKVSGENKQLPNDDKVRKVSGENKQ